MCRVRLPPTVFGSLWISIHSFLVVLSYYYAFSGLRAGFGLLLLGIIGISLARVCGMAIRVVTGR